MRYSLPYLNVRKMFLSRVQYVFSGVEDLRVHTDIFGSAKRICIYAGELYFDFYEDERFLNNLRKSLELGCEMTAVFGPAVYVDDLAFLRMACKSRGVQLYKRPYRDPAHFKMIEDTHGNVFALVDEPHPLRLDKDHKVESALLIKGYQPQVLDLMRKFEKQLAKSEPIDVNNIIGGFSNRRQMGNEFYGFITQKDGKVTLAEDEQIEKLEKELLDCLPE